MVLTSTNIEIKTMATEWTVNNQVIAHRVNVGRGRTETRMEVTEREWNEMRDQRGRVQGDNGEVHMSMRAWMMSMTNVVWMNSETMMQRVEAVRDHRWECVRSETDSMRQRMQQVIVQENN